MIRLGVILTRKPSVDCAGGEGQSMRRASGGLILLAALALAGCRTADQKAGADKQAKGLGTARPKGNDGKNLLAKGPTWLDEVGKLPGAGTGIPKAGAWTNPADPNFNAKNESQDAIGGRVLDPNGKPARNVFVRIDEAGSPSGGKAAIGISTNNEGYFFTRGLKPGIAYELTAEATQDGRPLSGSVQTKAPNPILTILLRDDLPPSAAPVGEQFPPRAQPKPSGEAWSPGAPATGVPPATIGGAKSPASGGALPPPDDLMPSLAPKTVKPENVADGPKDPFKPPVVNIPSPSAPPIPKLPMLPPSFAPPGGGRNSQGTNTGRTAGMFTLLDTLERPWASDSVQPGNLVLVEFTTSTCIPCKQVIPVLKDLQSRYGASGLQLVGVMCDELPQRERAALAAKYSRDHNLNYALYVEPGKAGTVRDRFDVESYPHAVLLNASGTMLWKGHPGDRAKLEVAIKQNLSR